MSSVCYKREIEIYGSYGVVVLGGGPAGVCAAISAARSGASVLLVESTGTLGGMATSGKVGPLMTCYDRNGEERTVGGMFSEIVDRLVECGGAYSPDEIESGSIYTSFIERYHRHVTPIDSLA